MKNLLVVGGLILASAGCGSDDSAAGTDATPRDDASVVMDGTVPDATPLDATIDAADSSPGGESYRIDWGPVTVNGGVEDTRCVVKRLSNDAPIRVGQITNDLGSNSHHLIVYRVNDTEEQLEPFPCDPFTDTLDPSRGSPLTVTQKAFETITLPPGVAFTLEPNQMIRLEMHFVNYTAEPAEIASSATFVTMPESEFEHEADFLFIGNPDIDIGPRSPYTLGPTYFPLPAELEGVNFFSLTGHTHQHGTDVQIATATGAGDTGNSVYNVSGWLWDEPDTVYHDPPFQVPAGGGFRFTCEYMNTSNSRVGFGESANDEMCFFWAYYYPSRGSQVCIHTDQLGSIDICCPGTSGSPSPFCSAFF
ncbi:MAG: hypothetical protein AAGF12_13675 [Myxococcota bacterium]